MMTPREERKYDLILFGATGFTGKLAVEYLVKQYPPSKGLKWAIAGRTASKLDKLNKECGSTADVVIADSGNEEQIMAMAGQTRVVVTTAGPFARYGTVVVKACAEMGTDYSDICGEADWVRDMITLYDDKAKASGARIVHCCGHDCVPWDLMTLMLAKKLKEKGETVDFVDMYDDISTAPSGGTVETALGMMFGEESKKKPLADLGYDPLLKVGSEKGKHSVKNANIQKSTKGEMGRPYRVGFLMAGVNCNIVKRSNALLQYGEKMTYREGMIMDGCCASWKFQMKFGTFMCLLACPLTRPCARKCLPNPGEGPSDEKMASGYLTVTGVAYGSNKSKVEAKIHFPTDPGYRDTSRMLIEAGLTFVLENDFKCEGGVYTPASCQGEFLLKRLVATGSTFEYVE